MSRLPTPGGDNGQWGEILNDFLLTAHAADGSLKNQSVQTDSLKDRAVSVHKLSDDLRERIESIESRLNSFTAALVTEISLFNLAIPDQVNQANGGPAELATRFYATVPGKILGVRFYKSATDTGVHVGSLRNSIGAIIATTTFINESVSGWQYQAFETPVDIAANTHYIVSYHSPTGNFSRQQQAFNYALQSGWLIAPASTPEAPNGMYANGSGAPTLPAFEQSCYFADVIFKPTL